MNFTQIANGSSYIRRELMKDDYVSIKFSSNELHNYKEGTNLITDEEGVVRRLHGQFYKLSNDYIPSYNSGTGGYDYDMKFEAWYLRKRKVLFRPEMGYSPEWTLTQYPSVFFDLLGYNFACKVAYEKDDDGKCVIDKQVGMISVTFNGTNCLDALNMIVSELDKDTHYYEWWFDVDKDGEDVLHIGKLASNVQDRMVLSLGMNISSMQVQDGVSLPVTKLHVYGGTRNLSNRYGKLPPAINATDEIKTDKGQLIGYVDPEHKVLLSMFSASKRVYPKIYSVSFDANEHTVGLNSGTYTAIQFIDSVRVVIIENTHNSRVELRRSDELVATVMLSSTSESLSSIRTTAKFSVFFTNSADGKNVVYTYESDAIIWNKNTEAVLSFTIPERIVAEHNEGALLAMRVELTHVVSNQAAGGITVKARCTNFGYDVYSQDYGISMDGTNILFNPKLFPPGNSLANVWANKGVVPIKNGLVLGRLPYRWFTDNEQGTMYTSTKRLTLPAEYAESAIGDGEIEGQVVFDDIYPTMAGVIRQLSTEPIEEKDTNGELTGRVLNYISFLAEKIKDVLESDFIDDPAIIFTSGKLNGMEFQLKYVSSGGDGTRFCIIPNENYSTLLPNNVASPEEGDKYKIVGLDSAFYESSENIVTQARNELLERGLAYMKVMNENQNVYTSKIMPTDDAAVPKFGEGVTLKDIELDTRVIGFQHPLDLPIADWQVICGNSPTWKRIDAMERKLLK